MAGAAAIRDVAEDVAHLGGESLSDNRTFAISVLSTNRRLRHTVVAPLRSVRGTGYLISGQKVVTCLRIDLVENDRLNL